MSLLTNKAGANEGGPYGVHTEHCQVIKVQKTLKLTAATEGIPLQGTSHRLLQVLKV